MNALLLLNYVGAYQVTGKDQYREIAEGIIAYTSSVLSDRKRGGFYAHQDADVGPGDDGSYFTWTVQEVKAAVSKKEAEILIRYYDIDKQGDVRETPGRNVLWVATTPEQIAQDLSLPVQQVKGLIASGKARLREARRKRKAPFVDQTLFADRNGMMISAYLEAYKVLGREDLKVLALKSLDFLLTHIHSRETGLYHALSDNIAHTPGFLSDYVWMTSALLQAFQVTGDARYFKAAQELMGEALRTLWDNAGKAFFDFRPDSTAIGLLKHPTKSFKDTPTPSPNAMAALILNQLYLLTNANTYHERAKQTLETFATVASGAGPFASAYGLAVDLHLHPPAHAAIIGPRSDPRTLSLWQAALTAYRPGKIVATYDPALGEAEELPPPLAAALRATRAKGTPQAYVCVGISCSLPTSQPEEVTVLVQTFERRVAR